jgi:hypothetical protein
VKTTHAITAAGFALLAIAGAAAPTSSAEPAVSQDRLDSILLTAAEANIPMGTSGMETSVPVNHSTYTKNIPALSNPDCLSTYAPILDPVYRDSGYTAVSTDILVGPDNRWLAQAVVAFPSAGQAAALANSVAGKWKACAGQTVTAQTIPTTGGVYSEETYTLGSVVGDGARIALPRTGSGRDCQRALVAVANLVIDVNACGSPLADQGLRTADAMAAKAG